MTYNLAYNTSFWDYGKCDKQYDYVDQVHTTCTRHYVCPLSCFYEDYEDEYDDYESDETSFDETNDDDFGFDPYEGCYTYDC